MHADDQGLEWQIGVWDRVAHLYLDEVDSRFAPVVSQCVELAQLKPGEKVLDLGTGTGAAAVEAGRKVGTSGKVLGVDVSLRCCGWLRPESAPWGSAVSRWPRGEPSRSRRSQRLSMLFWPALA